MQQYKNPYMPQGADPTAQKNPFDLFRNQAKQQGQANLMTQQNALQRRMHQLGGGPSGAAIKMEQDLVNQNNQAVNNQINQINAQEAQQQVGLNEAQLGRDFQNKVFDFEQETKRRALDQADRQARLDEQGQMFNQAMAALQSPHNADRFRNEISGFIDMLDQQMAGKGGQGYVERNPAGGGGAAVDPSAALKRRLLNAAPLTNSITAPISFIKRLF